MFAARPEKIRQALVGTKDHLDAVLTLTDADRDAWRRALAPTTTLVEVIPNASEFAVGEPAPLTSKTVIAAGRLHHQKGFDRLIDAFAPVARVHPDWQLHIYGTGKKEQDLRDQIESLGVAGQVRLMGFSHDFEEKLGQASIYAMSSRHECLPMVLLESFSKGVPPVSFDCPEGPRQLIDDGVNGLLVEPADVPALTRGLRRLIEDEDLRRRLGAGALASARDYQVGQITDRWEALLDDLVERRRRDPGRR